MGCALRAAATVCKDYSAAYVRPILPLAAPSLRATVTQLRHLCRGEAGGPLSQVTLRRSGALLARGRRNAGEVRRTSSAPTGNVAGTVSATAPDGVSVRAVTRASSPYGVAGPAPSARTSPTRAVPPVRSTGPGTPGVGAERTWPSCDRGDPRDRASAVPAQGPPGAQRERAATLSRSQHPDANRCRVVDLGYLPAQPRRITDKEPTRSSTRLASRRARLEHDACSTRHTTNPRRRLQQSIGPQPVHDADAR